MLLVALVAADALEEISPESRVSRDLQNAWLTKMFSPSDAENTAVEISLWPKKQ